MTRNILYSFRRCPYAMRARLALVASEQTVTLREIVLRDKAPEFVEASPKATVPVMVLPDGTVLEESYDILVWALAQNDPHGLTQPLSGTYEQTLTLIRRCDDEFKPHLDHYKYASRHPDLNSDDQREQASEFLRELDGRLAGSEFLFGDKRSAADIGIAPFVRQFAHVDRDWFWAQNWPHLIRWLDAFMASDAFKTIMPKYPKWQAGDRETLFPQG